MTSLDLTEKSRIISIGIIISLLPVFAVMAYLLWQLATEISTVGIAFNIAIFTIILSSIALIFSIILTLYVNQDFIKIKYFPFRTIIIKVI